MDEVWYNGSNVNADIKITLHYISGTENLEVTNFTVIDTDRKSWTSQDVAGTLRPGETEIFTTIPSGLTGAELQKVTALAFCLDTYPIRAECEKDEPCMNKYY
jgi:hypothetical protein